MSRVAPNRQANLDGLNRIPFMDSLTHSIIKETSKTLKHYVDVRRREEGFILSPSIASADEATMKARFMYGTSKEYPPLYSSFHTDSDVKGYLRTIRQHQRESFPCKTDLEKQICLDEIAFHMRSHKRISTENQYFNRLQLNFGKRSHSSCSGTTKRRGFSSSAGRKNEPIIDTTAHILAELVKARQRVTGTNILARNKPNDQSYHNANPSPRQTDEPSNVGESATEPIGNYSDKDKKSDPKTTKKQKRIAEDHHAKCLAIMRNATLIDSGILCNYTISVYTGDRNGASTNAPVLITLFGDKGYTPPIELKQSTSNQFPFQRGQFDLFEIQTYHVGRLVGITIGHNKKEIQAGWYLNSVTIEDSIRKKKYIINCNAWLSSESADHKTMRDFQVSQQHASSDSSKSSTRERSYHHLPNYTSYSMKETNRDVVEDDIDPYQRENTLAGVTSDEYTTRERPFTSKGRPSAAAEAIHSPKLSRTNSEASQIGQSKETNRSSTQYHRRVVSPAISQSSSESKGKLNEKTSARSHSSESSTKRKDENSFRPLSYSAAEAAAEDDFFESPSPKMNPNEKVTIPSGSPEVPTASKRSPQISDRSSSSNTMAMRKQTTLDEIQNKSRKNSSLRSASSSDSDTTIRDQNERPRSPVPTNALNKDGGNYRAYENSSLNSTTSTLSARQTTKTTNRAPKSESDESSDSELDSRPPARLQNRYASSDSDDSDSDRSSKKYY